MADKKSILIDWGETVHMRIFDHYEIYNKETDEVYMIGYSDLLAHRNLKKYRDEYGDDSVGVKMIYKELD